jgi:hypothetical protein
MKKNTQKTHRFNIIDFMLIVTVLACLIGITVRQNLKETVVESNDTATITVMIRGLLKDNVKQIVTGDEYYNQRNGDSMGILQAFETKPAKIRTPRLDGTIATTEYIDRTDVLCTVEIEGLATDDGFLINGSDYIGCGSSFLVRSVNLETEWLVVDIEVDSK